MPFWKEDQTSFSNMNKLYLAQEPNNKLLAFYLNNNLIKTKSDNYPDWREIDDIYFTNETSLITDELVENFGILSHPKIGAYSFYNLLETKQSNILYPIMSENFFFPAPFATFQDKDTHIEVNVVPVGQTYDCYRIIVAFENRATEFVTYDTLFTFIPMYNGECEITIFGHSDEINIISEPFVTSIYLTDLAQEGSAERNIAYYEEWYTPIGEIPPGGQDYSLVYSEDLIGRSIITFFEVEVQGFDTDNPEASWGWEIGGWGGYAYENPITGVEWSAMKHPLVIHGSQSAAGEPFNVYIDVYNNSPDPIDVSFSLIASTF